MFFVETNNITYSSMAKCRYWELWFFC